MKKSVKLILTILLVTAIFASSSNIFAMTAVGDVNVNYGNATIDGVINSDEWSAADSFTVDSSTAKSWNEGDVIPVIKVYTLWDEVGFYIAADITDPEVMYSVSAYDGDGFQISLDVGQSFLDSGETRSIFYSLGCYEDGNSVLVRQESLNDGEMEDGDDGLKIKSAKTDGGWCFEMLMPWTLLNEDLEFKSDKTFKVEAGGKINALICYLDKDEAGTLLSAYGTTKNDENTPFDWGPNDHGITFTLKAKVEAAPAVVEEAAEEAEETETAPAAEEAAPETAPVEVTPAAAPPTSDNFVTLLIISGSIAAAMLITLKSAKKAKNR